MAAVGRNVLGMVVAVTVVMVATLAPPAAVLVPYGYGGLGLGGGLWDHHLLYDPFRVLEQSPLGVAAPRPAAGSPASRAVALARCDWKETPEAHVVTLDVPGVRREDVRVEVDEASRVLRVSGERHAEEEEGERDGVRWHRAERTAGRFWRRFRMPPGADVARVAARLEDGVLTVTVPKAPGHRGREPRVVAIDGSAGDKEAEVVKASKAEM